MKETVRGLGERLAALDRSVDEPFEQIDRRFDDVDRRFLAREALILEEGRVTRRHFDIVAERMKGERDLDQSAAATDHVERLAKSNADDHAGFDARLLDDDRRLRRLEQP